MCVNRGVETGYEQPFPCVGCPSGVNEISEPITVVFGIVFRICFGGAEMKHYWDLLESESESSIYQRCDVDELLSIGYWYTVAEAMRGARGKGVALQRSKCAKHFVSRFSPSHYEIAIKREQGLGSTKRPYEILNDLDMWSPTGKDWTYSTYRNWFGKSGIKRVKSVKKKPSNYEWYKEVNALWRKIVDECDCTNLNSICTEMVARGFRTKNGKVFTRQSLTYIVERVPEMDWSLASVEDLVAIRKGELYDLLEGVDIGSYKTKTEVYSFLGLVSHTDHNLMSEVLDDCGWRRNSDDWYIYWECLFEVLTDLLHKEGWLGWNTLEERLASLGFTMYQTGKRWEAWRLHRLCRMYGFDKESVYEELLFNYVQSWLSSYGGGSPLSDLCEDLNGRNYVLPNWCGIRHNARFDERVWTEELLQRAMSEGHL